MALDKAGLISTLTTIFSDLTGKTPEQKATEIGNAIDTYVKTASVGGTATGAQSGGPGVPITGTIS